MNIGWGALACALTATALGVTGHAQVSSGGSRLFKDSRAHLAEAIANNRPTVTLVVAAEPGQVGPVAEAAIAVGGDVRFRDEQVGYLRVVLPTHVAERVAAHSGIAVAAVSITGHNYLPSADTAPPPAAADAAAQENVSWLRAHKYRPQADLGLDALRATHPTFDGRGVTVAVLDGFVDPLLPDFADTRSDTRSTTPILLDQVNTTDPRDDDDPFWVAMNGVVRSSSAGVVAVDGRTVHLPSGGEWRVGRLDEHAFSDNFYLRGDLNRDGNPSSASRDFAIAWQIATNQIWIDTDQDGDLRDEQPMRDFDVARDVGVLGRDRPETPVRDSVGFTLTLSQAPPAISVNLGFASHGTEIAGALVARRSDDGLVEGTAPGAALINYWHGSTTHGLIEGALRAFQDSRVDLLVIEQNLFLTMDYALDDGRSVIALLLDRMASIYGKAAFAPANNIPGPGQLSDVGLGTRTFAVGAYESKASWWTFEGARVGHDHNISTTGSYGPAGTGRLKPDFVAPVHAVTPNPGFLAGGRSRDLYELAPGRAVCGGTSCATPLAAGVAASLISGARQSGLQVPLDRLAWAMRASALPLDLPAHAQGAGLLRADQAWRLLSSAPRIPRISISGPIRTAFSDLRWLPAEGEGTYVRENREPTRSFRITVRRLDGAAEPMRATLTWRSQPLFSSVTTVDLPLGVPVTVDTTVTSRASGIHSGILVLADPVSGSPWHLSLHAVVIPDIPSPANRHQVRREIDVRRPGVATIPIEVTPGSGALDLRVDAPAPVRLYVVPPDRKIVPYFQAPQRSVRHVVANPTPGVYYATVWNATDLRDRLGTTGDVLRVAFSATIYRASVTSSPDHGEAVVVTNQAAAAVMAARTSGLSHRRVERVAIDQTSSRTIDIDVREGMEWLAIDAKGDDLRADIDLFLFQCSESCGMIRAAIGGGADERLFIPRPRPGRYRLVVDWPRRDSARAVHVAIDVADPTSGSAVADDPARMRGEGVSWQMRHREVAFDAKTAVSRIPVVVDDLEAPLWTAPAALRGMGLSQSLSWFPLVWIEPRASGTHPE